MFTGIIEEIGKILSISSSASHTGASDNAFGGAFKSTFSSTFSGTDDGVFGQNAALCSSANARLNNGLFSSNVSAGASTVDTSAAGTPAVGKCLEIEASKILEDIQIGDSIAVNGVCLTARSIKKHSFCADVMPETLRRSNLGSLKVGSRVNLERAMKANGRFGGHFVLGHIDTCVKLVRIKKEQNAIWFFISLEEKYLRYIAEKGSLCINGVSLTVASIKNNLVGVSLIPHSFSNTNLGCSHVGDMLNIECDILAKHAENETHALGAMRTKKSSINLDFLAENGFI